MTTESLNDHKNSLKLLKSVALYCLEAFVFLYWGVSAMWEYQNSGTVTFYSFVAYGENAKITAWGTLAAGLTALIYGIITKLKKQATTQNNKN